MGGGVDGFGERDLSIFDGYDFRMLDCMSTSGKALGVVGSLPAKLDIVFY